MANIYKITSPSGRIYVGSSVNVEARFKRYRAGHCEKQSRLFASFEKYGVAAHIFEVLIECEPFEMLRLEAEFGEKFDVLGPNGLNCRLPKHDEFPIAMSQETKDKIRLANKGKSKSPEHCKNISDAKKGCPGWNLGLKHSAETIKKQSDVKKGKKFPKEKTVNMGLHRIGKKDDPEYTRKRIYKNPRIRIVLDLQTGIFYDSCVEASGITKYSDSYLHKMLKGVYKNKTNFIYV